MGQSLPTRPPKPMFCPMVLKRVAAKTAVIREVAAFLTERSPVPVSGQDGASFLRCLYPQGSGEKVLVFSKMESQGQLLWLADRSGGFQNRNLPTGPDGVWFLPQPVDGEFHPNPRQPACSAVRRAGSCPRSDRNRCWSSFIRQTSRAPRRRANRRFPKSVALQESRSLICLPTMDQVIKLVKTYRLTAGLAERLRLAEEIFRLIEPDLRFFVFSAISAPAAQDVLQEVLQSITTSMKKFAGGSTEEFWAWCYRIARNRLNDHFRKKASDRLQPMPPEELWELVESSAQASSLSPADKHDLEYAMKLLTSAKPECHDYLWKHFVFGMNYAEIAEERNLKYDNVRMKIGRCLDEAKSLVA